jgi:pyrimidine operon attenuation protein/uracil phosphoribosyltransferase
MTYSKKIYDESQMISGVNSIADDIIAHFSAEADLAIVGIQQMGVVLAEKIFAELARRGRKVDFGKVDITMHRDDIGSRNLLPMIRETEIDFDVNGCDGCCSNCEKH